MKMAAVDPRTPVIVGVGQFVQRPADPAVALEPVAMMVEAVRRAADDAGAKTLLPKVDAVRVVKGAWPYRDPGRLVANWIGASPHQTALSTDGGNTPQSLVNRTCLDIQQGQFDVVVLVGAEGIWSRRRARRQGQVIPYTDDSDEAPAEVLGHEMPMSSRLEMSRGFEAPVNIYPTFENAIRASRSEDIPDHLQRISTLWESFNRVAVDNPYAWVRTPMTAEDIRTASANNRMVGFPYTKAMNSNWDLDQAAAVIVCSAAAAESLAIERARWVFPWSGTDAHDTLLFSNRDNFYSSPAIRTAGRVAFELAGRNVDDVAHVDLYSCFPSAVQIAATELGLAQDRQLTVTGGLPFAGGPLNNYVMHSIATMTGVLREHPGELGLCSANGGYVTKHAIGLYSTEPPPRPFGHADVQEEVDRAPRREAVDDYTGPATLESYTVMHGHDGPEVALVSALTPQGQRVLGSNRDGGVMRALMEREHIGKPVEVRPEAAIEV
jgi:acetyl-CoA C-acetyltransferase